MIKEYKRERDKHSAAFKNKKYIPYAYTIYINKIKIRNSDYINYS